MKNLIYLLLILIGITSCNKEKSKKWIIAEVTFLDEFSNDAVAASVQLEYYSPAMFGSIHNVIDLGLTDENGTIRVEHKVKRKDYGFKLVATPTHQWYHIPHSTPTTVKSIPLEESSDNSFSSYFQPTFPFSLRVTNVNCQAPSDSIWIMSRTFAGCVDTLDVGSYGNSGLGFQQNITVTYTVKKLGVINNLSQDFILEPLTITPIEINY